MLKQAREQLRSYASESDAVFLQGYFKTGPGEYGEGDVFLGVRVPITRRVARKFRAMDLADVTMLLRSRYHEERLLALVILTAKFARAPEQEQLVIYNLYMANLQHVNNWDLVDSSAHRIVGAHLFKRSRRPLYKLAGSGVLWERRIAIMATLHFIVQRDFVDTLALAEILLEDPADLIHKAVGWMLREVGNQDRSVEEGFLRIHYRKMPRTMLRYAIEKFPGELRQDYLKGRV